MDTNQLREISKNLNIYIQTELDFIKKQFLNKDAVVTRGKYKGRRGKITSIIVTNTLNGYCISMMVQPYSKDINKSFGNELLWDHYDARSYWSVEYVEVL